MNRNGQKRSGFKNRLVRERFISILMPIAYRYQIRDCPVRRPHWRSVEEKVLRNVKSTAVLGMAPFFFTGSSPTWLVHPLQ